MTLMKKRKNIAIIMSLLLIFTPVLQMYALENETGGGINTTSKSVEENTITDKEKYEAYKIEHAQKDEISSNQIIIRIKPDISIQQVISNLTTNTDGNIDISTIRELDPSGIYVVNTNGINMNSILEELNSFDEIVYAQPNYKIITSTSQVKDNDWGLQNNGQKISDVNGVAGIDINATAAWNITTGSQDIIVGVLDTGVDTSHESLAGRTVAGWDFVNDDDSVYDMDVVDEHGTYVASLIAGNSSQMSGIASNVKIMPLKAFTFNYGYTVDIIDAIQFAKENGVKIINCSFADGDYNNALAEVMYNSDILFVCSAGNFAADTADYVTFPACFGLDNIVSVAAVTNTGEFADFTTYGDKINMSAPGKDIYGALPGNKYGYKSGTSASAAYVSGAAALMLSENRNLSVSEIKEILLNTAREPAQTMSLNSESISRFSINPLLDVASALTFDTSTFPTPAPTLSPIQEQPTEHDINIEAVDNTKAKIRFGTYKIYDSARIIVSEGETVYTNTELSGDTREITIDNLTYDIEYSFNVIFANGNEREDWLGTFRLSQTEEGAVAYISSSSTQTYTVSPNIEANAIQAQKNDDIAPFSLNNNEITPYATDRYESESNNTISSADRFYDGDNMWGAITSSSDVDFYKISFSSTGSVNFWLGNIPTGCYYTIHILNSSGTVLKTAGNAPQTSANIYNFNVTSGTTYYVKVHTLNSGYSTSQYLLRAKWYPEKDSFEDNQLPGMASVISGTHLSVYATINHPYDIDYYKFTLTNRSWTDISFWSTDSGTNTYTFELLNSDFTSLINYTTRTDMYRYIILQPGTYYIKVCGDETSNNYSSEEYSFSFDFTTMYTLSSLNSTRTETMELNGICFEIPSSDATRGVDFLLTNPSGINYDLYLYEWEVEIAHATTTRATDKISTSLELGNYFLFVRFGANEDVCDDFTLQTTYITVGNSAEVMADGTLPDLMKAGSSQAIGITATNTGANTWTKNAGYTLRATGQNSSFGAGANQNLSSTAAIKYSKFAGFDFNISAPNPSSTYQSYTLGWRMQQNGIGFGNTFTHEIGVVDPETLSIGTTKNISGVKQKWYKITFPSAGTYVIRTYGYSLGCDTELDLWNTDLQNGPVMKYTDDISETNLYSKALITATANQTVYLQIMEHNGSNLYTSVNVRPITESTINAGDSLAVSGQVEGYFAFTPPSAGTYTFYTSKLNTDCDTYLTVRMSQKDGTIYGKNDDVGALSQDSNYSGALYSKVTIYLNSTGKVYIQPSTYDYYKRGLDENTNCLVTVERLSTSNILDEEIKITSPVNGARVPVGSTIKITGTHSGLATGQVKVYVNDVRLSGLTQSRNSFEVDYQVTDYGDMAIMATGTIFDSSSTISDAITITGIANSNPGSSFSNATALSNNTPRTFEIGSGSTSHYFSFVPPETGSYFIKSLDVPGENLIDMAAELYDTDQTTVLDTSFNAPDSANFALARTLEANKTYYIRVFKEVPNQIGKYTIMAQHLEEPNDAHFGMQWNLLNKGNMSFTNANGDSFNGVLGVDINVLPAWQYTKGEGVTIAVIDSGVDASHEDLSNNVLSGYNFVHNSNNVFPSNSEPTLSPNAPFDDAAIVGHGTHVAGIAAAQNNAMGNTNPGIIGVAPQAKILPIKSLGNITVNGVPQSANTSENLVSGLYYAADAGAQIVNLSVENYSIRDSEIEAAIESNSNALHVICAGNNGDDLEFNQHYPACVNLDNTITVANMRANGELDPTSCFGGPTQLAAPGTAITSTLPSNQYGSMSGTSMAAPHVSGVAALLLSYNPELTIQELRSRIINNVTQNNNLSNVVTSGGYLNAFKALTNETNTNSTMMTKQILSRTEKSIQKKQISEQGLLECDVKNKTNKIFVNFIDASKADEVLGLLDGFNYQFIRQMGLTNSYLLSFDSIDNAEEAIYILNESDDVYYASMNYIY